MPDGTTFAGPIGKTPNWLDGYVPPAAEWNAWWAMKLDASDAFVTSGPYLPLTGGTLSGRLTLAVPPVNPLDAVTKAYVDNSSIAGGPYLALAGGTMTGRLNLIGTPVAPNEAATKAYVDINVPAGGAFVPTAGGTMIGSLVVNSTTGPPLHINGPAGTFRNLSWDTGNVPRFRFGLNSVAESGVGNAGSDLVMTSFTDSGAVAAANVMTITRSTGVITFGGPLNYTATGSTTPRSAQDRAADWLNVRDYGAKLDGVVNDTGAFNAARTAAKDGQTIFVPKGQLVLSALAVDTSKQVRWMLDGVTTPGGGDNIVFAPAGCGDFIESFLTSGTKFFAKRTNQAAATGAIRVDYILDTATGSSSGFLDSAIQVNSVVNDHVLNALWGICTIVDNNCSDPVSGGVVGLQSTVRKHSAAGVQAIQTVALDDTGLPSSANGGRGFASVEFAQRANNVDDAGNGAMWGGTGNRIGMHLSHTIQDTANDIETSFSAGIWLGTDPASSTKVYVKSGVAAAMNYQTYQFIDTRGCIPPYVSSAPVASVRMLHEQVVDFNGGPALNSAPGNYLQYTTSGGNRLRYMAGATERFTLPDVKPAVTGSRAGNAALASLIAVLVAANLITDSTTA